MRKYWHLCIHVYISFLIFLSNEKPNLILTTMSKQRTIMYSFCRTKNWRWPFFRKGKEGRCAENMQKTFFLSLAICFIEKASQISYKNILCKWRKLAICRSIINTIQTLCKYILMYINMIQTSSLKYVYLLKVRAYSWQHLHGMVISKVHFEGKLLDELM